MRGGDLAILVPSRGRPASVRRLAEACAVTCTADTALIFGFDYDDPALAANIAAASSVPARRRPPVCVVWRRQSLAKWTNALAETVWHRFAALASIGDDHVPLSQGWDTALLAAAAGMAGGAGMAYPDDRRRADLPEAIVMSSAIPRALGWMCLPTLAHYDVDSVWRDLGTGAGCLAYCPDVLVEHRHYDSDPAAARDATYAEAEDGGAADRRAFMAWRQLGYQADLLTIKALQSQSPS